LNAFKDKFTTIDLILEEGDLVAAYGTVETTHSGEFLGMPATGKRIKLNYMDFWRFDESGECVENWVHLDIIDVFRQVGGNSWMEKGGMTGGEAGFSCSYFAFEVHLFR